MASLQFNLERVPTLFLSVCLPLGAGGSRGRLRSVRAGSRSPARPPRGAALSPKEGGVELYYLLWTEGGKQEPSSAAGFDCCSQHGTHRGDTNTHTYTPLMYNTVWYRIYNHIVGCVCVCVDGVIPIGPSRGRWRRGGETWDQHIWQSMGRDR